MKNIIDDIITNRIDPKRKLGKQSLRELSKKRTARIINDYFLCNPDATPLEAATTLGYSITTIYKYM